MSGSAIGITGEGDRLTPEEVRLEELGIEVDFAAEERWTSGKFPAMVSG